MSGLQSKLSVENIDVKNKRVLLRVDFNVPLDKKTFKVKDPKRIQAAIPTIRLLLKRGARSVVLMSHLGRPDGAKNPNESLKHVLPTLEKLLGAKVTFLPDCVGPENAEVLRAPAPGSVFLLENLRFYLEEEKSVTDKAGKKTKADEKAVERFCDTLSSYGDVYVNDAFGAAHRAHSSITGIKLPVKAAGLLMRAELNAFGVVMDRPPRSYVAVLGGAKVSDKIQLIENLLDKVDALVIGGGMAYTFKKVAGMRIGSSIFDDKGAAIVGKLLDKAKKKGVTVHLPVDFVIANKFADNAEKKFVTEAEGIPDGWQGLDIGPKSAEAFAKAILGAKTIVYNGTMGVSEMPSFAAGTKVTFDAVVRATRRGALSFICGGDTGSAAVQMGLEGKVTHISTGGGASLELLEGKTLPGVAALSTAQPKAKL